MTLIWWKKDGFYFVRHQTNYGRHLAVFQAVLIFCPGGGPVHTQGSFFAIEAGSWGVSSPQGSCSFTFLSAEAPRFGKATGIFGLGAKLPNIVRQHNRKSVVCCVLCFLLKHRHGQIILTEMFHFLEHSGKIESLFICTKLPCDSDAHPVRKMCFAM